MVRAGVLALACCGLAEATLKYRSTNGGATSVDPVTRLMEAPRTLSATSYARGSEGVEHPSRRMEFQTLTVDDLVKAGTFYSQVLGADELSFCEEASDWCTEDGFVRFSGDEHQRAMFSLDAVPELPDLSDKGDMEVHSRFFALRNAMVQLIAFFPRKPSGKAWTLRDPHTTATYVTNAHICFWIEDGVDANLYIEDVENRSASLGLEQVRFNRPMPQKSEADRATVPKDRWANCAEGGIWEGNCAAYFKGPVGEQYEVYAIERTFKQAVGRAFCERQGAGPAFVSTGPRCKGGYCNRKSREHPSQRLHGVFQQGFRTKDIHRATGFYTEVLGGDLMSYPAQGKGLMQSDAFQWQIFANETFEAWKYADEHGVERKEAMHKFGIPDISPTGRDRLDLQFILFDNFVVEPLEYSAGLSYGADGFDPELNHSSSPSYVTTISAAFGVSTEITMTEHLDLFRGRLQRQGFSSVKAPEAAASFPEGHPYSGLEYTYAKGPDGEALSFVRMSGAFQDVVKKAFASAGVVSTLFSETDAYANGDMAPFCRYAAEVPAYGAYEIPAVASPEPLVEL